MSPFDHLPIDVVHVVFLYCLPADHNPYICASEPPMLLTHVCRRWRRVAFEMPLLWAKLHVHIPFYPELPARLGPQAEHPSQSASPHHADPLREEERRAYYEDVAYWEAKMRDLKIMVFQWLARAKGCQISLSLSQFTNILDSNPKGSSEVNEVIAVLLAWCAQWKSVEIYASSPVIAQFLAVPTQKAPLLQRISIKWQTPMERNINRSTNKLALVSTEGLMTVPELKSLSLQILPRNIMSLPVRWEGLTELIFDEYFGGFDTESSRRRFLASDALELLALCPRLRRCRLAIGRGRMISTQPSQPSLTSNGHNGPASASKVGSPIQLPELEHLAIDEGVALGSFFLSLSLPSLKEVVFSTAITPLEEDPEYPSQPSQQSGASASIQISHHGLVGQITQIPAHWITPRHVPKHSPLIDLLSQCGRQLEKLTFDEAGLSLRDIERALVLVPNLKHLAMSRKSMLRCTNAGYSQMAGRWKPSPGHLTTDLLESHLGSVQVSTPSQCKLPDPVTMQDSLIAFLQSRRRLFAPETLPLLQKATINMNSHLATIAAELAASGVDMLDFELNVFYPMSWARSSSLPESSTHSEMSTPSSPVPQSRGPRGGISALMWQFVPQCRGMTPGMYGYGSWYANGGGGEFRDAWFE
ncbi:hypothetical protein BKA70DRAFT_1372415 [Coprinopsis sp. MPI-PUGE-AT-0042]|nr:hypothetical protein BKA70DRAFT_1372415 [Coprinopsis sp. MPI-PUGE-AT-0042]